MTTRRFLLGPDVQTSLPVETFDGFVDLARLGLLYTPALQRGDDLVIAEQPAYMSSGEDNLLGGWVEQFGFRYQGHTITLTLTTPRDAPQSERDTIAATILGSVEIR